MKYFVLFALVIAPVVAVAGDLMAVKGHYAYIEYAVSLPNGRVLHLSDLGASSATLDVAAKELTLRMTMKNGQVVTQTAKVLDAQISNGSGFWEARWPDMTYSVRAEVTVQDGRLTSVTKFDNASDTSRYGSIERATLLRSSSP